jgi:membrane associated rhomboid family serine protease
MKRGGHGRCRRGALASRHALSVLSGLFNAKANGGGIAFFAHVGGFIFGVLVTRLLVRAGQAAPQDRYAGSPLP